MFKQWVWVGRALPKSIILGMFNTLVVKGSLWTLKSVFARQRENVEYPDAAVS